MMLFRPLYQKRLFGIPVPLTPGIIPRQREQLAQSIGRMVSRELITEETLASHFSSPQFNAALSRSLENWLDSILDFPLEQLLRKAEQRSENPVGNLLQEILLSSQFSQGAAELLYSLLQSVDIRIPVNRLSSVLESLLSDPDQIEAAARRFLEKISRKNTVVEEGSEFSLLLEELLTAELPSLGMKISDFLEQPAVKKGLEQRGVQLLRDIFRKFSGLQRFFITAGQYDITLERNMDEIVSDLIRHIRDMFSDPVQSREMAHAVISTLREKGDISRILSEERIDSLSKGLRALLSRLPVAELSALLAASDRHIHSRSLLQHLEPARLESFLAAVIARLFSQKAGDPLFEIQVTAGLGSLLDGKTLAMFLPGRREIKENLIGFAIRYLPPLIEKRSKTIIEAIDVYALVVNKINSLDIAAVERLLLQVIEKHLKWINLFGAVLGGLIGAMQLLLRMTGL